MIHSISPIQGYNSHIAPISCGPIPIAEILEIVALDEAMLLDGVVCGYKHHHALELVTYYTNYPRHVDILS